MAAELLLAELVVMIRLAEGGCCTALPSQFAYTESRNRMRRTSPLWLPVMLCGCLHLWHSYRTLTLSYNGIYVLHLP